MLVAGTPWGERDETGRHGLGSAARRRRRTEPGVGAGRLSQRMRAAEELCSPWEEATNTPHSLLFTTPTTISNRSPFSPCVHSRSLLFFPQHPLSKFDTRHPSQTGDSLPMPCTILNSPRALPTSFPPISIPVRYTTSPHGPGELPTARRTIINLQLRPPTLSSPMQTVQ